MWSSRGLSLACLLLVAIAVLAPTAPASAAVEAEAEAVAIAEPAAVLATTPEAPAVVPTPAASSEEAQPAATSSRAARHAAKLDERRTHLAAERARRRAEKLTLLQEREERDPERENVVLHATCHQIEVHYRGFPALPGNTVVEFLTAGGEHKPAREFTFDGSEGTDVIPFVSPAQLGGHYHVDVRGKWETNGFRGNYDLPKKLHCPPEPGFTLQKLQRIGGSEGALTTAPLEGHTGQTVDYAFRVTNTGNVPLTFELFEDKYCDAGTLTRSTMNAIAPGEVLVYECTHLLSKADEEAGSLTNVASVIGAPPSEFGLGPEGATSNPVVIAPITPPPPAEEKVITNPTPTPEQGVLDTKTSDTGTTTTTTTTTTGKTGVLGFSSATVPVLKGPRGCVRGRFHASIKSTGVASVTFYVDGKKLKTLTSKNAHGGLLTVLIDPSRMKVGPHRVSAKITMKASSATAKAARATRALTVVHCASAVITPHFTG